MDVHCPYRTIGGTTRGRQLAAAGTLLLGAGACAVATLAGWPLYQVLLVLGAVATLAWLIDGSSQRIMGPALTALAVGGGITLYTALGTEKGLGEHGIVYPLIGAALLVASLFNPLAMRGAGTFLLIVAVVAQVDTPWSPGWTLVAVLALWSAWEFARIARSGSDDDVVQRTETPAANGSRTRIAAGASR